MSKFLSVHHHFINTPACSDVSNSSVAQRSILRLAQSIGDFLQSQAHLRAPKSSLMLCFLVETL